MSAEPGTAAREPTAAAKYPRRIEIVDDLPQSVTGTIVRRALRG